MTLETLLQKGPTIRAVTEDGRKTEYKTGGKRMGCGIGWICQRSSVPVSFYAL